MSRVPRFGSQFAFGFGVTAAVLSVSFLGCDAGQSSASEAGGAGSNAVVGASATGAVGGAADAVSSAGVGNLGGSSASGTGYHVVGNKIFDQANREHHFYGVSRPSLEWNADGEAIFDRDWDNIKSWGANVVRLPLNQVFWRTNPSYRVKVAGYVQAIEKRGMDVILDLHWSEGPQPGTGAQRALPDAGSVAFWTDVATTYGPDPHALFELYNEPEIVDWKLWLNGGTTDGFQAVGMKALYDAVRATGAQNLTLFGGLEYAYRLSGFPGIAGGFNVVLVTHPYDTSDKQPGTWPQDWGAAAASYPVIATEFGRLGSSKDPCDPAYPEQVIDFANAHGVSWLGWAWYVKDCAFPSLITDYASGTPTATGAAVKAAMLKITGG